MLQRETVAPQLLDILKVLMSSQDLQDLRLVGGTALALQLGHRNSVDIDMFGNHSYSASELDIIISDLIDLDTQKGGDTIRAYYTNNVKIDIVRLKKPWLEEALLVEGVRMASLKDIAAMKIGAITGRGSKKDFIDLYVLLQHFSLIEILSFYQEKYSEANIWLAERSITYFGDADIEPMPEMFIDESWDDIKSKVYMTAKENGLLNF